MIIGKALIKMLDTFDIVNGANEILFRCLKQKLEAVIIT